MAYNKFGRESKGSGKSPGHGAEQIANRAENPNVPWERLFGFSTGAPNLPAKIIPAKIRRLKLSGRFPMDMRIPPLKIKILLESEPLKSRILVERLAVQTACPLLASST